MRNHLVQSPEENSLLSDIQGRFRKNRICLTQLFEHFDALLKVLSDSYGVNVIYLDYSKAFDKLHHQILFAKLRMYRIIGNVYRAVWGAFWQDKQW